MIAPLSSSLSSPLLNRMMQNWTEMICTLMTVTPTTS